MHPGGQRSPRIAIVGPCASGKSTLVSRLVENGYDAYTVAQEHSAVRELWKRKNPDVLIVLDVSLEVIRQRRSPNWPAAVYDQQRLRLASSFESADLIIDTGAHDANATLAMVEHLIRDHGTTPDS